MLLFQIIPGVVTLRPARSLTALLPHRQLMNAHTCGKGGILPLVNWKLNTQRWWQAQKPAKWIQNLFDREPQFFLWIQTEKDDTTFENVSRNTSS